MAGNLKHIQQLLESDSSLVERVERSDSIWKCGIFEVDRLQVSLPSYGHAERDIVEHHGGCAVALTRGTKMCLVRQYRVAIDEMTLEIPAGKREVDESPRACAARELKEETGYTADTLELIARSYGSCGFTNECTHIYRAEGLHAGETALDADEFLTICWVEIADVLEGIAQGLITDSKTIIAAQALALARSGN